MQHIGKYIRKRRLKTGQSLNSFSYKAGIEPAILSRIENEKQDIKFGILCKIANEFGQTPAEFLTDFEKDCLPNIKY